MGGAKAAYFESRGYRIDAPHVLEGALLEIGKTGNVLSIEPTRWGTKYLVVGEVMAPDGNPMRIGTLWIIISGGPPSLVTAYPVR